MKRPKKTTAPASRIARGRKAKHQHRNYNGPQLIREVLSPLVELQAKAIAPELKAEAMKAYCYGWATFEETRAKFEARPYWRAA